MTDEEIIELIAHTWLNLGGDSEGFVWSMYKIKAKIEELEKQ